MLFLFSVTFRRLPVPAGLRAPQAPRLLFLIDPSSAHPWPASSTLSLLTPFPLFPNRSSQITALPLRVPYPHSHPRHYPTFDRHSGNHQGTGSNASNLPLPSLCCDPLSPRIATLISCMYLTIGPNASQPYERGRKAGLLALLPCLGAANRLRIDDESRSARSSVASTPGSFLGVYGILPPLTLW
jgi:hypothetical protein